MIGFFFILQFYYQMEYLPITAGVDYFITCGDNN
nr:MAG TPA: hypothetical protein [Caudoviricetes sp.]